MKYLLVNYISLFLVNVMSSMYLNCNRYGVSYLLITYLISWGTNNIAIPLLKIQMVLTSSLHMESNVIECDPDSLQEVDHRVIIVY
jgi:hypothetical protein